MFNVSLMKFSTYSIKSQYFFFFSSKVPQIHTIYQQKSAQGISLKSLTIEVISYSVSTLYNFTNGYRLMNYFEYIILLVQDYILIIIVLFYRKQITKKTLMVFAGYAFFVFMFAGNILPKNVLTFFIVSQLKLCTDPNRTFYFCSLELCLCQPPLKYFNSLKSSKLKTVLPSAL
jgi:signal transduction histidine kinase